MNRSCATKTAAASSYQYIIVLISNKKVDIMHKTISSKKRKRLIDPTFSINNKMTLAGFEPAPTKTAA